MIKLFWNTHNQIKPNSDNKKIRDKQEEDYGWGIYHKKNSNKWIYEVLKITDRIKEAILDEVSIFEIEKIAGDDGLVTMKECAKGHLQEGEISFDEFHRVMIV